jgi:hypothetical protein
MLCSFQGRVAGLPVQKIAIGLTGEPVAAGSRRGATTQRNDQRFSSSHTATRSSNCDGARAQAVVEGPVEDHVTQGVDVAVGVAVDVHRYPVQGE